MWPVSFNILQKKLQSHVLSVVKHQKESLGWEGLVMKTVTQESSEKGQIF